MQAGLLHCQLGNSFHTQTAESTLPWVLVQMVCMDSPVCHMQGSSLAHQASLHCLYMCYSYGYHRCLHDCKLLCIVLRQEACQCIIAEHAYNLVTIHHFWRSDTACCLYNHALLILMLFHCPSTRTFGALL